MAFRYRIANGMFLIAAGVGILGYRVISIAVAPQNFFMFGSVAAAFSVVAAILTAGTSIVVGAGLIFRKSYADRLYSFTHGILTGAVGTGLFFFMLHVVDADILMIAAAAGFAAGAVILFAAHLIHQRKTNASCLLYAPLSLYILGLTAYFFWTFIVPAIVTARWGWVAVHIVAFGSASVSAFVAVRSAKRERKKP